MVWPRAWLLVPAVQHEILAGSPVAREILADVPPGLAGARGSERRRGLRRPSDETTFSVLQAAATAVLTEEVALSGSFQCPACGRCFARQWHLKRHLATHLAVKPFKCPYCPHGASIKDKLKQHIRKIHPGEQVPADFEEGAGDPAAELPQVPLNLTPGFPLRPTRPPRALAGADAQVSAAGAALNSLLSEGEDLPPALRRAKEVPLCLL
ncbi:Broad-complex protein isoform 4 [Penaeus vannamei]|uniref:Broad-complex protein isoform 4 n=1 Tax=Penaeus vannamei TaxID=6689 RepID=A0A423TL17_PENVA|nr:Broad-complex protein isoform 4 [Penaeus vannamei]